MEKFFNAVKGIGIGVVILFFIVAGKYMNQVTVNEKDILTCKSSDKVTQKIASASMRKANDAFRIAQKNIESNEELVRATKELNKTISGMGTTIAVTSEKVRNNASELKEIKKIVKQIAMRK